MDKQPKSGKPSPNKAFKGIRNALENKTKSQDKSLQEPEQTEQPSQPNAEVKSDEKSQLGLADKLKKVTEGKLSHIWTEERSDQFKARVHGGYERAKIVANQTAKTLRDAANSEGYAGRPGEISADRTGSASNLKKNIPLPPEQTSRVTIGKYSFRLVDVVLAALAFVFLIIFFLSVASLLSPISAYNAAGYDKARDSGFTTASPETTSETPAAKPEIDSISVISIGDGDGDHPELANKMLDGDPDSFWQSRFFGRSSYPDKAIYLVVKLTEPAPISDVTITSPAQGGTVQLLDPKSPDETTGEVLAKATFAPTFDLKLHDQVVSDHFTLKIPELPKDKDGRNRAWIGTVSVR